MKNKSLPHAYRAVAIAVAAALLVLAAGCTPSDTGVRGVVRIGPVSPVETAGTPASKPYAAELVIRSQDGSRTKRVQSGADGTFEVNLAPGTYIIAPAQSDTRPTAAPVIVTVRPHQFAKVKIDFDSGIR